MSDGDTSSLSARVQALAGAVEALRPVLHEFTAVAAKTKLLGFNASILAAQAGIEGRSFAVVAEQMKALNQRASVATGQLNGHLDGLERAVHGLREAVHAAGTASVAVGEAAPGDASAPSA